MNVQDLLAALTAKNWILVSSLVVGLLVRLMKDDTKLPINVPSAWRPRIAMVLGIISGCLLKMTQGLSWKDALLAGGLSGIGAILGHEWIVERLLGDNEIPIPGLMKKKKAAPKKEDDDKPPPTLPSAPAVLASLALMMCGCASWWQNTPDHLRDVAKITECVLSHQTEPVAHIASDCAIDDVQEIIDLLNVYKAQLAKEKAGLCVLGSPAPSASVVSAPSVKPVPSASVKPAPSASK